MSIFSRLLTTNKYLFLDTLTIKLIIIYFFENIANEKNRYTSGL